MSDLRFSLDLGIDKGSGAKLQPVLNIKHIDGLLANSQRKKVDQWFSGAGEIGAWGVTANEYEVSFCNDPNYVGSACGDTTL